MARATKGKNGQASKSKIEDARISTARLRANKTEDFLKPSDRISQLGDRCSSVMRPERRSKQLCTSSTRIPESFKFKSSRTGVLPLRSFKARTTRSIFSDATIFSTSARSEEHTSELQSQSNLVC